MDDLMDLVKLCVCAVVLIFCGVFVILSIAFGTMWFVSGFEVKAWNKLHNTNYTQLDWFGGSDFIQKYHYPDRENAVKSEIKLNVN